MVTFVITDSLGNNTKVKIHGVIATNLNSNGCFYNLTINKLVKPIKK